MTSSILATTVAPILEVLSDRVIHVSGKERLEYWDAFHTLYAVYPYNQNEYGEIWNRNNIGKLLTVISLAAELESGNEIPKMNNTELPCSPLSKWSVRDWEGFGKFLQMVAKNLMRNDANAQGGEPEDNTVSKDRSDSSLFGSKVKKMIRYIQVQTLLSNIRPTLTEQLLDPKVLDDAYLNVDDTLVQDLWKSAMEEHVDPAVQDIIVRKLFEHAPKSKKSNSNEKQQVSQGQEDDNDDGQGTTDDDDDNKKQASASNSHEVRFKTVGQLREVFAQKPFSFDQLLNRINVLVSDWSKAVFDEPRLNAFFFPEEVAANSVKWIEKLRQARTALRLEGQDPLDETLRLTNELLGSTVPSNKDTSNKSKMVSGRSKDVRARDPEPTVKIPVNRGVEPRQSSTPEMHNRKQKFYERNPTAVVLRFEDSQVDNVNDEDELSDPENARLQRDGTHHLSRLPNRPPALDSEDSALYSPRKKRKKSQQKQYRGRRPWTDQDKQAILDGIRQFGVGKWANIKAEYIRFEERTSGQIKDCFRNMLKNNEVPAELLKSEDSD